MIGETVMNTTSSIWQDKYIIKSVPYRRRCFCHCGKCQINSEHNIGFIWEQRGERWFKVGSIEPIKRYQKEGK
jgi:hypothetical protein